MSVMKFICSLIWNLLKEPEIESSPFPDDWPPENSVHFMDVTQSGQEFMRFRDFPRHFKMYEFTSNWAGQEADSVPLAHEIIKRLCENQIVLTGIESTVEQPKKKKQTSKERFTVRYHRFLKKVHPLVSAYAENERKLDIVSTGFHGDAFFAYEEIDTADHCCFEFYLFPEKAAPLTAQQARTMARNKEFNILLWMNDSPVGLNMVFNPNTADINFIQSMVEDVCKKRMVPFSNPPRGKN